MAAAAKNCDPFPLHVSDRITRNRRVAAGIMSCLPPPIATSSPRVLDVGCGINKYPGAIGVDRNPHTRADVLCELDRFPYPFRDSSFGQVRAIHVIEHVADVIRTMEEFHRLTRPAGEVFIATPHYTDFSSFCDPTHRWHLNSFSLRYFGANHGGFGYYSGARFDEISVHVKLLTFWRCLGFQFLVNHSRRYRRFWENYLCYVVRGKAIEWRLRVVKAE
ncbi:MAG: methyltransferase domain-containing protein [Bryobacteraceae bacterium]